MVVKTFACLISQSCLDGVFAPGANRDRRVIFDRIRMDKIRVLGNKRIAEIF